MKFLLSLVFLFLFAGIFLIFSKQHNLDPEEKLAYEVINKTADIIEDKYLVRAVGNGAEMFGGPIQVLMLDFSAKERYSKEELRVLLIDIAHEFVKQVNENKNIEPFLKEKPFTINNVEVGIFNYDRQGGFIFDPEFGVAEIYKGVLTYRKRDPENIYKSKEEKETYEEALAIIEGQKEKNR